MTHGMTQGLTHGIADGETHGMTHGLTDGVAHGMTYGVTHGITHGVASVITREIDLNFRVERRWKQWKQSLGKFSCILYNYNPAVNSSMDIAVFSTSIFLIYSPRGTFSGF
ncbi:hypothetical protein [Paenibacillus odorifer]|uniref:hypothetical protein n=1 Tax=Paenibacillus odorifer TaxID=189426 RepID=UPI00118039AD|nr:hypothetical protein [Paenibacillus odorifer]